MHCSHNKYAAHLAERVFLEGLDGKKGAYDARS